MRLFRCAFMLAITLCLMITTSGCVYSNNKSWSDMNAAEKEEVRQNFAAEKAELEETFSENSIEDNFASYILNQTAEFFDNAN